MQIFGAALVPVAYHITSQCMYDQSNVILEVIFAAKKWSFTRNLKIICFTLVWNQLFLIELKLWIYTTFGFFFCNFQHP